MSSTVEVSASSILVTANSSSLTPPPIQKYDLAHSLPRLTSQFNFLTKSHKVFILKRSYKLKEFTTLCSVTSLSFYTQPIGLFNYIFSNLLNDSRHRHSHSLIVFT